MEAVDDFELPLSEVDAKTLLLGDIGENGMWWTGNRRRAQKMTGRDAEHGNVDRNVMRIHWSAVHDWYHAIFSCGRTWKPQWQSLMESSSGVPSGVEEQWVAEIEQEIAEARLHVQRTLLKATEKLLYRPGRPLKTPHDGRFLLILLRNPILYPQHRSASVPRISAIRPADSQIHDQRPGIKSVLSSRPQPPPKASASRGRGAGQHSGIIKRLLGLVANLSTECHQLMISWLCRFSETHLRELVELVGGFVSYRLGRQTGRGRSSSHDLVSGLVPDISGPGAGTSAHLHAALGINGPSKAGEAKDGGVVYGDDWQIKAAAKVMSLIFAANNTGKSSQMLPTDAFYNTLVDYADLTADFQTWESRTGKFSFCQYPMFLSIWAKIHIMEYDARRQMEVKAREAFFNSILSRKAVNQYLVLKVRRDCLVDDSLRSVSEIVGTGQEEIKKGLKIEFLGEEGVDAGG
jgi:E3 ubiquitin-protein ligase HECTD2